MTYQYFSDIVYSSDSTSHKHIEYESRTIALKVIDYSNPDIEPVWKMRTFGVGTSVNHTSITQVNGLRKRLDEICNVFNNSPLAKRLGLVFQPDYFIYKCDGSSGDHANDQKRSHEILAEWKMEVVLQRLGEQALVTLSLDDAAKIFEQLREHQINEIGGHDVWASLTAEKKADTNANIMRRIGKVVFDALPAVDQAKLTRFIRTGCCMHKDLNTVKGGDRAMQESWISHQRPWPVLLANKDNTAVLNSISDQSNLTTVEKRALEGTKRGGSHATLLGGLICRHKDKKKDSKTHIRGIWRFTLASAFPTQTSATHATAHMAKPLQQSLSITNTLSISWRFYPIQRRKLGIPTSRRTSMLPSKIHPQ